MQDIGDQRLGKQGPGHLEREGAEGALMRAAGSFQKGGLGTRLAVWPEALSRLFHGELGRFPETAKGYSNDNSLSGMGEHCVDSQLDRKAHV